MLEAPLLADAYDLAEDLCARMEMTSSRADAGGRQLLSHRITGTSLDLLSHITLAIKGFDTFNELILGDRALVVLRVYLRLAVDLGLLDRSTFEAMAGLLDSIAREIDDWLKGSEED
jgi:hypothetical protein